MMVKQVFIRGESTESWEGAALNAVQESDLDEGEATWAQVQERSIDLSDPQNPHFKVEVALLLETHVEASSRDDVRIS